MAAMLAPMGVVQPQLTQAWLVRRAPPHAERHETRSRMSNEASTPPLFTLSPSMRKAILTAHIVVSVGLLGDSAGYLAVAARAAAASDPTVAEVSYERSGCSLSCSASRSASPHY